MTSELNYKREEVNASKEFLKGLLFGQLLIFTLLVTLVRIFILRGSSSTKKAIKEKKRFEIKSESKKNLNSIHDTVLNKLEYNLYTHPSESCDWINVLIAIFIESYRRDNTFKQNVVNKINNILSDTQAKYSFIAPIILTDFALGDEYPQISKAKISQGDHHGMTTEFHIDYNDCLILGVDTNLMINWPRPCIAALPVSLSISLLHFSGKIMIEYITPIDSNNKYILISLSDDYQLELDVKTLLGHRTKIKDPEKLSNIVIGVINNFLRKEFVYPNYKRFDIPNKPKID
ncbi:hypothetical protein BCR32DRAFT_278501 [Anaeromyces robustus]|uniref:Maintenance of mitochondrial morphology protein 1 n=1 Tax=Anaeromyces robustus TaxID=1754192 RepID=A0A1Y1XB46_9FUNG|nr:hypothetical protein BCR32DRAFT_278501 [Anaeromyces robustus]|eukprot:ORX82949.1 hypothetical protein BCR32DRAFT_278501 [Anaeromyces robustus]